MNFLLDTHAFYWWDQEPGKLSIRVKQIIEDPPNVIFLSVVNILELIIKIGAGKLIISEPISNRVSIQIANGFVILPVTMDHVLEVAGLPMHHKDPFDRLLIAQAQLEQLTLLNKDSIFSQYPVQLDW